MNRLKEIARKIDITFKRYSIYEVICCLEVIMVVAGTCMLIPMFIPVVKVLFVMYSLPAIGGLILRQVDKYKSRSSLD